MARMEHDNETYDFGPPQICSLEALKETGIGRLGFLQRRSVLDISEGGCDLSLPIRAVFAQLHETVSRFFDLVSANSVPRGLWGEVSADEQRNRPDPLEDEGQTPAEITLNTSYCSDNARGEENSGAPAHAHVGGKVGSENGGDHFRRVGSREGLTRMHARLAIGRHFDEREYTYLENAPSNTTHSLSPRQDCKGGREYWDEDHDRHPHHEEHHGFAAAKSILGISIDQEPGQLANKRRVR